MRIFLPFILLLFASPNAWSAEPGRYAENYEVGLTFFELGQYERAAEYLRQAVDERPNEQAASVLYGISLVKLDRHKEAIRYLESAKPDGPRGVDGLYFLGTAYKETRQFKKAKQTFQQVSELSGPLSTRALLEIGRVAVATGDLDEAAASFESVLQLQGARDLVREARLGLADVERRRKNRSGFSADLGVRYDSNVRLDIDPASGSGGFRALVGLQGRYRMIETASWRSEAAVAVEQGRYFDPDLQQFDLGVHRAQSDLTYKVGLFPVRVGASVGGFYHSLDFSTYSAGYHAGPRLLIAAGEHLATSASWKWEREDFAFDARDAIEQKTTINQFVFWGKSGYAGLGGSYQTNRAKDLNYNYDVASVRLFGGDQVGPEILIDGGIDYVLMPYLDVSRKEQTMLASLGVGRYWGWLGGRLSGLFVRNRSLESSGETGFDYDKYIFGADVRMRF